MARQGAGFAADGRLAAHYAERHEVYGRLTEAMTPLWQRMAEAHNRT